MMRRMGSVGGWFRGLSPVARGAFAGLLVGVAGGLLVLIDGRYESEFGWRIQYFLFYLSFPTDFLLWRVWEVAPFPDEWREGYARFTLVAWPVLNAPLLGAAGVAFVRKLRSSRTFRRVFAGAMALEGVLIVFLAFAGVPNPFGGAGIAAYVATEVHEPGIFLLTRLGLCCGDWNAGIGDVWFGPAQRPTPFGLLHIAVANAFMLLLIAGCALAALQSVRRRRMRPVPGT